jgi:hypothetical protein
MEIYTGASSYPFGVCPRLCTAFASDWVHVRFELRMALASVPLKPATQILKLLLGSTWGQGTQKVVKERKKLARKGG